jgi:hypothetical protein
VVQRDAVAKVQLRILGEEFQPVDASPARGVGVAQFLVARRQQGVHLAHVRLVRLGQLQAAAQRLHGLGMLAGVRIRHAEIEMQERMVGVLTAL